MCLARVAINLEQKHFPLEFLFDFLNENLIWFSELYIILKRCENSHEGEILVRGRVRFTRHFYLSKTNPVFTQIPRLAKAVQTRAGKP